MIQKVARVFLKTLLIIITPALLSANDVLETFYLKTGQIQVRYAPDQTLEIFSASLDSLNGQWILSGESTVPEAQTAVINLADSLLAGPRYENRFVLLPEPALGDSVWAVVSVSTAQLRSEPKHAVEMIDQTIMGSELRLLKKEKMWYLARTEYGYIGWIAGYSLHRATRQGADEWRDSRRVIVTALVTTIWSEKDTDALPVSDAVLNMTLRELQRQSGWTKVETPDRRVGYMLNKEIAVCPSPASFAEVSRSDIIKTAKRLIGIPYLWGGNSAKGNDCSGFTQTVFKANGLQLPRDARQQALIGGEVIALPDFSNVLPGDLLFFGTGERITHVGISLGGFQFIHQDSDVNIASFNEKDETFNSFRKKTLKKIKRVLSK